MKDFLDAEKSDKLKQVLLSISASQVYFKEQGMLTQTIKALEDIYWQEQEQDQYRHLYSDLFVIITQIDKSAQYDNEILSQNLLYVCKHYRAKNKDNAGVFIDISKSLFKLYDHVNLDIARLNYSKACNFLQHEEIVKMTGQLKDTEKSINNQINDAIVNIKDEYQRDVSKATQKLHEDINEQLRHVQDESSKMRAEYISILGIFASIVLAFVGSLTYSTSVLSNIHKASIYRIVILAALIGMVMIFILWLMMDFIKSIHGQNKRKYSYILLPEAFLFLIILGTVVLYRWDYFQQEKINSIYENCVELESEEAEVTDEESEYNEFDSELN